MVCYGALKVKTTMEYLNVLSTKQKNQRKKCDPISLLTIKKIIAYKQKYNRKHRKNGSLRCR